MDGFGCFFLIKNLEFDSLWLFLALSFVGAGFMLFFIFFVIKPLFMDEFGSFFGLINQEFNSLWLSLALSFVGVGLMLFLIFCYKTFIYGWI